MKPPAAVAAADVPPHLELTAELHALTDADALELVHRDRDHALYRAPRRSGGVSSLVKVVDTRAPSARALAMLRWEYEVLRDLDIPGVARVTGLLRIGKGLALVMDEAGPQTLAQRLARQRFDVPEMLDVAVQLAETVARLQARHLVHRALAPENVLWNPESLRTTLVGFGNATTVAAPTNERPTGNGLESEDEDTSRYSSPEQTGRTNQQTDYRTDHYALGTIFYEVLVGHPPFDDADRVSLIHAHVARRPVPPHECVSGIPSLLSELVVKLLAKAPEERYQAAEALASDLKEIRSGLTREGGLAPFRLGRHDVAPVLEIPDALYGREDEIDRLRAVFTRVVAGGRELLLVRGRPGVGKTALVSSLEPWVLQLGGFFVAGKFDQLACSVPYSALVHALSQLARRLLAEPEAILASWRTRIQSAVYPNGQLLADVIPELVHVLGPQPAVTPLGPVESRNRVHLVFEAFVRVFTGPAHPLVIFLDDVQWIDASSLGLIERLLSDTTCRHLLLVLAYRDSEVTIAHPVALAIAALRKSGATVGELEVASR